MQKRCQKRQNQDFAKLLLACVRSICFWVDLNGIQQICRRVQSWDECWSILGSSITWQKRSDWVFGLSLSIAFKNLVCFDYLRKARRLERIWWWPQSRSSYKDTLGSLKDTDLTPKYLGTAGLETLSTPRGGARNTYWSRPTWYSLCKPSTVRLAGRIKGMIVDSLNKKK